MKITFLLHAREQMEERGISEEEAWSVLEEPDSEGLANFGRLTLRSGSALAASE